ncbi:hypothetical protein [Leifsonia shinshuensis]|uniref:hypothetical protein n=1 Tax=Leifsonia shinshuensis TaxID=150026 RepID=UPI001628E234|nr:hypothetical protein [Leifsonia shinshuensis]
MSRQPVTCTAVWMRERACAPLIRVETPAATARVTDLAAARGRTDRRTRRRTRRAA